MEEIALCYKLCNYNDRFDLGIWQKDQNELKPLIKFYEQFVTVEAIRIRSYIQYLNAKFCKH